MSTSLTKSGGGTDIGSLTQMAEMLCKSRMVPKDYINRPQDILVAAIRGQALGLDPVASMEAIAMVTARAWLYGDAFLAIIQSHPQSQGHEESSFAEIEKTGIATCTFYRGERKYTGTFSVNDAKRARLWGKQGPWSQYPSRMLQMRARGFAGRGGFADALKGLISEEEARDLPEEPKFRGANTKADIIERVTSRPEELRPLSVVSVSTPEPEPEPEPYVPDPDAPALPYGPDVVDAEPQQLEAPKEPEAKKAPAPRASRRQTPPSKGLAKQQ